MNQAPLTQAGSALVWKVIQHAGVKGIFVIRLFVLARLLSPDDFGLLAVSSIILDLLLNLTNISLIPALIQRREVTEQHYQSAWTAGLLRGLAVSLVTFFSAPLVAAVLNEPRAVDIIRVISIQPLLDAAASIKIAELHRNLNFRPITLLELLRAFANASVAIALAPVYGVWALVGGAVAGLAIYVSGSYLLAPFRPALRLQLEPVRSLIQFGQWLFFTGLLATLGQSLLRGVISRQLGSADMGLYYIAASVAIIPTDVASQVISQVAFPLYSRLQTDLHRAAEVFRAIFVSTALVLVPVLVLLMVLAPVLQDTVLGSRWMGTAHIIQILVFANLIGLFGDTVIEVLKGAGRPHGLFWLELVQSTLLVAGVWLLANRYGLVGAALAWLPALFVSQVLSGILLRQIIPQPLAGLGRPLGAILLASVLAGGSALAIVQNLGGLAGLISALLVSGAVLFISFWFLESWFRLGLFTGLSQAFPKVAARLGLVSK